MARPLLFGPVAFTLIGGSFGICWAMLYRQSPHERAQVFLEDSFQPFFGGALLGLVVGMIVLTTCISFPGTTPFVRLLVTSLLGLAIAAPLGWIIGDYGASRRPQRGMIVGGVLGAAFGLCAGTLQRRWDKGSDRAKPGAARAGGNGN
jgi:hypothetical protein